MLCPFNIGQNGMCSCYSNCALRIGEKCAFRILAENALKTECVTSPKRDNLPEGESHLQD